MSQPPSPRISRLHRKGGARLLPQLDPEGDGYDPHIPSSRDGQHAATMWNPNSVAADIDDDYPTNTHPIETPQQQSRNPSPILRCSVLDRDNPYTPPLNWDINRELRKISSYNRQAFRRYRLERWLKCANTRLPNEPFGSYLWRCFQGALVCLKTERKMHIGDRNLEHLDRFVVRLYEGTRMRLARNGIVFGRDDEMFLRQLLREECEHLFTAGLLYPEQHEVCNHGSREEEATSQQQRECKCRE